MYRMTSGTAVLKKMIGIEVSNLTKSEFINAVNANGGPECVLNVILDNSMFVRYIDDEHILNLESDLVTIGGVDYIKNYTVVEDNRPAKRKHVTHTITTLHPMECVQGIQFISSKDERNYLDKSQMYEV